MPVSPPCIITPAYTSHVCYQSSAPPSPGCEAKYTPASIIYTFNGNVQRKTQQHHTHAQKPYISVWFRRGPWFTHKPSDSQTFILKVLSAWGQCEGFAIQHARRLFIRAPMVPTPAIAALNLSDCMVNLHCEAVITVQLCIILITNPSRIWHRCASQ